jgi:hypothetical protein
MSSCLASDGLFRDDFYSFGLLAPKEFKNIWLSNLLTETVPEEWYSRNCIQNVLVNGSLLLNTKSKFIIYYYHMGPYGK